MENPSNPFQGIFIRDTETATDLLYFEAIAKTVAGYIQRSGDKPISIGIHGDWGAGKSSVLKMIERQVAGRNGILCLWFNGWQFEGYEDAKAALIEHIVLELRDSRSGVKKVMDAAADVLRRLDYLKIAKMAVKYGGTFVTGIPHPGVITDTYSAIKAAAGMVTGNVDKETIVKALEDGAGLLKEGKNDKRVPEEMKEFRKAFTSLLDAADISQLVVLIDDLDRCLPETSIATLEAIRLFLFIDRTAFVIGADEQMIEYSVKRHFPDFQRSGLPDTYARNYLEKLIQVPFRIPALGAVETQCYVSLVMAEAILTKPDQKPIFAKLVETARSNIMRPWSAQPLEAKDIDTVAQGDIAVPLKEAVGISSQIYRVLSDGTKGNPRLIKRFLNAVLIRHAIASERQISGDIKLPQLAKVMLAERFHPSFFDQLVDTVTRDAGSGKPEVLKLLETASTGTEGATGDASATEHASLLEEWKQDPRIMSWARVQPPLAGEDLRPYIFITRDRQQSIFGYSMGTRLAALVEKLCEDEYSVSGATADVKALDRKDTLEVAQNLKSTVLAAGDFKNQPRGFEGLVSLTTHKPEVRKVLLNCLQNIPIAELGAWVWPPFKTLFDDPALKADAEALERRWAQEGNKKLKTAITKLPR